MQYETKRYVREIEKDRLLLEYRMEGAAGDSCSFCPDYQRVWSCPPGLPEVERYLEPYRTVRLVAVQVCYPEEEREKIQNYQQAQEARQKSYEQVKKSMLLALLEEEKEYPGSRALGAGRCSLCERCTRMDGAPCRFPEKRRYSITGFGLDFSKMMPELFALPLLWKSDGLPEYDVAIAALLLP